MGSDVAPVNSVQVIYGAFGLFLGGLINANIFGELSYIVEDLYRSDISFQQQQTMLDTMMIRLGTSQDFQRQVNEFHGKNVASKSIQNELKDFLDLLPPSLRQKVFSYKYIRILKNISYFKEEEKAMKFLTSRMKFFFTVPEYIV